MTIKDLLGEAPHLAEGEAELLLADVLGQDQAWLLAHTDEPMSAGQVQQYNARVERRINGEPVAYIVGHKEFYGRDFDVTPDVLIPRPDSEVLIEEALSFLKDRQLLSIVDIGTGSGCLIITLAIETDYKHTYTGLDISAAALAVAQTNAKQHNAPISFIKSDLLDNSEHIAPHYDLIIANLPYLSPEQMNEPSIQYEPKEALLSGLDGLDHYRRLLHQLKALSPQLVLMEIDPRQTNTILSEIQKILPQWQADVVKDLSGHDRVIRLTPRSQNQ